VAAELERRDQAATRVVLDRRLSNEQQLGDLASHHEVGGIRVGGDDVNVAVDRRLLRALVLV